ncbi:MAG: hypothetical protein PGN13_11980 [Patulibacter minatonensis]
MALAIAAATLPSTAQGRRGPAPEPVFVIPGYIDCTVSRTSSADWPNMLGAVHTGVDTAYAAARAAGRSVEPVPADWYLGWAYSACGHDMNDLAKQLDTALAAFQARTGAAKIDVVSFSLGGIILRYCATNAGGQTPLCASRIDDWVGLVNATQGSQRANLLLCAGLAFRDMWSACLAIIPGSLEIRRMNARGPAPFGVESSIYWTPDDDYISPPTNSRLPGAANHRTTSPVGPVLHAEIWGAPKCPAMPEIVGRDLIDTVPHAPGDSETDCSARPAA